MSAYNNLYSSTNLDDPPKSEVMPRTAGKMLGIWLFTVCFFITILLVFGGFVRLTRSGLSIVEWRVVTGVIPPIGETAWQETFEKYRQTPEYQQINTGITLAEYRFIYYMEYIHRLLGRLAGLVLVVPLFIFLVAKIIPRQKAPLYLGLGVLFALQGLMGWYMVKSGLVDQPHVSHYRLTAHLLLALLLFGGCFWLALENITGASPLKQIANKAALSKLALGLLVALIIQIAYGGFVAGLKAGHVSDTFPLMGDALVPPDLLSQFQPWLLNLVANPTTVHFIHRWFAFIVLALAMGVYYQAGKSKFSRSIRIGAMVLLILVFIQILLGIEVILRQVPISVALIHQGMALLLFAVTLFINYRVRRS